jgi:hypothetical protein
MVGQYSKNNLIARTLRTKYPNDNFEEFLHKNKKVNSTWDLSPKTLSGLLKVHPPKDAQKYMNEKNQSDEPKEKTDYVREGIDDASAATTVISMASAAPKILGTLDNVATNASAIRTLSDLGNQVAGTGRVAGGIGAAAGAIGTGLSAVSLGKDIYDVVDKGKVTFDNAMHFADDGTSLVAGTLGMAVPGIGTAIGLGLEAGEKLVTGIIKASKAVKEEKEKEGVDHLPPDVWFDTVGRAIFPAWMFTELGKPKPSGPPKEVGGKEPNKEKVDKWISQRKATSGAGDSRRFRKKDERKNRWKPKR